MSRSAHSAATSGGGAPSELVDLCIIPIAQRSIQSSPDPYGWSALRMRTRGGIPLAGAPLHAPAALYWAPDTPLMRWLPPKAGRVVTRRCDHWISALWGARKHPSWTQDRTLSPDSPLRAGDAAVADLVLAYRTCGTVRLRPFPRPSWSSRFGASMPSQERLATRVSGHALGPRAALAALFSLRLLRHFHALRRVWLLFGCALAVSQIDLAEQSPA